VEDLRAAKTPLVALVEEEFSCAQFEEEGEEEV
jgi:hypothetical protein